MKRFSVSNTPSQQAVDAMPPSTVGAWSGLRIFAEPLTLEKPEDRIRAALGAKGGKLPEVGKESLQAYYKYLSANMSLPFQAQYPQPVGLHEEIIRTVTVVGLLDPAKNLDCESLGLLCKVCQGKQQVELSLADLEVTENDPNHELIEDYWYWFWNWR
jgi:hypothetical protein